MKKFLMVATVPSMIGQFNMDNLHILLKLGYEVHVACNFTDTSVWTPERIRLFKQQLSELGIKYIQVEFARTPYDIAKLIKGYKELRTLIIREQYAGIHCHTPVAGMITRLAAHGTKSKVIYTAHGFHFYKGAPLKNWLIYYPVEKMCSYMTDVLLTINKEDFALAKSKMKAKRVLYVPGVGVDTEKFDSDQVHKSIKGELGVPHGSTMILSIGELNENKNHESVIRALAEIGQTVSSNIYYVIVGKGVLEEKLKRTAAESGLEEQIILTGFRTDVIDFYHSADIFVFPSYREGLSVALMEAMASGLPIAASHIRGNCDLIDLQGGNLFNPHDISDIQKKVLDLLSLPDVELKKMGTHNKEKIKNFSRNVVQKTMTEIYKDIS